MTQSAKDWIQYSSAAVLIASAIAMAFVSLAITDDIGAGPLTYIGEALSAALAIFGIGIYFAKSMHDFKSEIRAYVDEQGSKNEEMMNVE